MYTMISVKTTILKKLNETDLRSLKTNFLMRYFWIYFKSSSNMFEYAILL